MANTVPKAPDMHTATTSSTRPTCRYDQYLQALAVLPHMSSSSPHNSGCCAVWMCTSQACSGRLMTRRHCRSVESLLQQVQVQPPRNVKQHYKCQNIPALVCVSPGRGRWRQQATVPVLIHITFWADACKNDVHTASDCNGLAERQV